MLNRKKIGIIILVCFITLAMVVIIWTFGQKNEREDNARVEEKTVEMKEESTVITDSYEEGTESQSQEQGIEQQEKKNTEETKEESKETSAASTASAEEKETEEKGRESTDGVKENDNQSNNISFPYEISGTTLTVEHIGSYDGIFLEDGSDEEVNGIAAMVLKNTGENPVEYADISLKDGKKEFKFEVSDIPAGETVVVQEKNRKKYKERTYTSCSGIMASMDELEMSEETVHVEETEDGKLEITNLTEEEIPCVRIFYKFYMEEEETYVGGITYTAKVAELAPGESRNIIPSHYVSGNSRVMMVRTYKTSEE